MEQMNEYTTTREDVSERREPTGAENKRDLNESRLLRVAQQEGAGRERTMD